jgi:hypothetical protein
MRLLMRRVGVCWCGVALVLAGLVVAAPQVGAKTPVVASGGIGCDSVVGKAKFVPPLVSGAAGTSTMSFSATLSDCDDAAGVTSGKVKGSATLPTDCTQDLNVPGAYNLGAIQFRIKWHGSGKFADTVGGSLSDGFFSESGPENTGTAGFLVIDSLDPSASGSFVGSGGILLSTESTESPTQLVVNCTPKTKILPGSGGLKKLTIDSGGLGAGA